MLLSASRSLLPRSRFATAPALRYLPQSSTLTPRRLTRFGASTAFLGGSSEEMLQGAVLNYKAEEARNRATKSNASAFSREIPAGMDNPGYKMPLKPTNSSFLNQSNNSFKEPLGRSAGVKRTANGVAKIVNGSFEDELGSQKRPITLNDQSPEKQRQQVTSQLDLFDENDFDSDIDLEIQPPSVRETINYPKLPPQPQRHNVNAEPTYPTLPKIQPSRNPATPVSAWSGTAEHGHPFVATPTPRNDTHSSAPVDWSSSPVEHFVPASKSTHLDRFVFQEPHALKTSRAHHLEQPQQKRKRVLPWADNQSEEQQSQRSVGVPPEYVPARHSGKSTMSSRQPQSLWNTSASAVKEGLRKHREEMKKAEVKKAVVKKVDGTEESIQKAKTTQKRPARVFLSDEQQHVLDLVIEKKRSVFFTGSAGTGKSVLMREIISSLRKKYAREPDRVAVTASTGLAACNVGGVTLHSFAGIGLGKEDATELVRKIKKNQKAKHRWMRTKVLVMDEVSMVDGELFDKLESIARQIRNNARPFGGIQLVITGDFFQLPPVPDNNRMSKFAFDAATWKTSIEHTIGLHHVFRQKDPIFAGMLNEMREGRLSESSIKAFQNLSRPLESEDQLVATELFPTRAEVDKANSGRLSILQGGTFPFAARDGGSIQDKVQRDRLLQNCMAPEMIVLKKGAQVMLIKNIDETLVNGSIGRVIGFQDERDFDIYNTSDTVFPQSPGGTLLTQPIRNADALSARALIGGVSTSMKWPLVRFTIQDGTYRDLLCQPETWKVELPSGEVQASRAQVPLILAWALSIHKAQGQTLERVKVDLGKVFEKGQAYVALSRATSMAGLQVLRFDPRKVNAHERVRTFYSNLARVELADKNESKLAKSSKTTAKASGDYESMFVNGDMS